MNDRQQYIELLVIFTNKDEQLFKNWTDKQVEDEYERLLMKEVTN